LGNFVSIDLAFDDAQESIATALSQFCAQHCDAETVKSLVGKFPNALWRKLADLGVLAVATPEGDGGSRELVAAMETLGYAAFPGPLAATVLAMQLLPESERASIAAGRAIVAVGCPPLFPFGTLATVLLEITGEDIYRVRPIDSDRGTDRREVESVDTLGGETFGRIECERIDRFEDSTGALALYRVALAAYLVGAGDALVRAAAAHATTRKQFGQPIGQFQAVSHPLADCHIRIEAARMIARSAADQHARGAASAPREACAAHYAARRAATEAAHTCHQVFGAVGIALEGPAFHLSRRIMQLAAMPPDVATTADSLYRGIRTGNMNKEAGR
jgi:alkylation response protein AidB-like acyl-CoA dehydrogenase